MNSQDAKMELNLYALNKIRLELRRRYLEIYNLMSSVQLNFENKIFKKDKYNVLMEKLDDLFNEYKSINKNYNIEYLDNNSSEEILGSIYQLREKVKIFSSESGTLKVSQIINLYFGYEIRDTFSDAYNKLIDFYDNFFIPTGSSLENDKSKISGINLELLPYAVKTTGSNKSFLEKIEGAEIFFPIYSKFLVISGYFRKDPLNITRNGGTLGDKLRKVEEKVKNLTIEEDFVKGFLNQLSLRDFILNNEEEICDLIENANKDLIKYRSKPLSLLVKEFITANIEKQRYILTLFLLSVSEDQFLAHIIYDMICNTSELLKPQPMAEEIYKSLHYTVQKLFRIAFKNVEKKVAELQSLTEDDIPYEKRIAMMKANDTIKSKALEKLKEVKGTRESSAKAQQYLDGLLKIPFGTYKREPVLTGLNDFMEKIKRYVSESKEKIEGFEPDSDLEKYAREKLLNHLLIFDNNCTESTIDAFLKNMDTIIESIKNHGQNNSEEDSNEGDVKLKRTSSAFLEKMEKIKALTEMLEKGEKIGEEELKEEESEEKEEVLINVQDNFLNLMKDWVKYKKSKKDYLENVRKTLNDCVHGHDETKSQLERLIAQWMNGKMDGTVFGFQGPPGTGKTTIAKKGLSKCLVDEDGNPRPFGFLPLGGSSNGAVLEGHSYTYLGSTWGRIVDILMETKCMNPIIYIDEVDKVSNTEHGREIIGILTHLTDMSQNHEFTDKYFAGIKFDLSKVLFVFSYNDPRAIDRILRDRITEINVKALTLNDKVHIVNDYALPEILETVGFRKGDITFSKETIEYIVETYTYEAGVRKLREKLFEIIREINLKNILDEQVTLPFEITVDYVKELFSDKPKVQVKKIAKEPQVGIVNGLYATTAGVGGITLVQVTKTPSDRKLALELTGSQGDDMKESMLVAKTLAWNLLPKEIKKEIQEEMESSGTFGLHIHVPSLSTPKSGPSATNTVVVGIISRLCGIPVRNDICITGEGCLSGKVMQIGGLDSKLEGGWKAGCKKAVVPMENEDDVKQIMKRRKDNNEPEDWIEVIMVDNINEVLDIMLVENDIKFNKI